MQSGQEVSSKKVEFFNDQVVLSVINQNSSILGSHCCKCVDAAGMFLDLDIHKEWRSLKLLAVSLGMSQRQHTCRLPKSLDQIYL